MGAPAPTHPSYVVAPVRIRERTHRRQVLVAMAALIMLSATPVFGHHLAVGGAALLAGHDHLLGVCLIALHRLLEPVHTASHLLLLGGVAYAGWDRAHAWRQVRSALRGLETRTPTRAGPVGDAAALAGVPLHRIRIVRNLANPAFTVGWVRPIIYIASALPERLACDELAAVLAHENAHVSRHDPLRLSSLRFLACSLFFLPALRRLAADAADDAEIAADDAAAGLVSARGPLALAQAIVTCATHWGTAHDGGGPPELGAVQGVAGFQRADLLERRVRRLLGEDTAVGTNVTRRSLAGAATALSVFWMSGLLMAHPLPSSHCAHHALAVSHLFCLGVHGPQPSGAPCPHAGR